MMEHSVGEETSSFEQEVIGFLEYCLGNTERILVSLETLSYSRAAYRTETMTGRKVRASVVWKMS